MTTRREFMTGTGLILGAAISGHRNSAAAEAARESPAMSVAFSPVLSTRGQTIGSDFSTQSLDLRELGERASPVTVLDDFRVSGRPFGPHPHAGLSAVSYVFEDSPGPLRSSDSLGNSIVMGPGGVVWTQAGAGMMHEEIPAVSNREVHGLQIFVNLSSKNKFVKPQVLQLAGQDVPVWRNHEGDRVRVAVGSFKGVSSPLIPAEPFLLLDVELRRQIEFPLEEEHNLLVNVIAGSVLVSADGREMKVPAHHGVALHGTGQVTFKASERAQFLLLSGGAIHEPVVTNGPFIMNSRSQIEAAMAKFRAGGMGHLEPFPEG